MKKTQIKNSTTLTIIFILLITSIIYSFVYYIIKNYVLHIQEKSEINFNKLFDDIEFVRKYTIFYLLSIILILFFLSKKAILNKKGILICILFLIFLILFSWFT